MVPARHPSRRSSIDERDDDRCAHHLNSFFEAGSRPRGVLHWTERVRTFGSRRRHLAARACGVRFDARGGLRVAFARGARARRLTQPSPVSRARVSLVVHARSTSPRARRTSISRRDPSLRPVPASSVVVIVARAPDPVDGAHFARIRRRPRARPSSRRALVADARCRPRRRNGLASSISEGARAFPPTHRARRASCPKARQSQVDEITTQKQ